MWAPIANNLVSVAVLVAYLVVYGPAQGDERCSGFDPGQELLLGLGSTLGIVVQFLILIPYLRAAGVRYRPRFDFRDSGLGHTLRLGIWTVLVVVVNQIAYTVVVRLASGGTAQAATNAKRLKQESNVSAVFVPHSGGIFALQDFNEKDNFLVMAYSSVPSITEKELQTMDNG